MFTEQRKMRAVFRIQPDPSCPLRAAGTGVGDVRLQLRDGGCQCDLVFEPGETTDPPVTHAETEGCKGCTCHIFQEVGCIPKVVGTGDGHVLIETFVGDESAVWELLEALKDRTASAELLHVKSDVSAGIENTCTDVDLSVLTRKQREALDLAIEAGYYCRPRETTLRELATQFDISKQALGQRLSRAEEKVMEQLCP